jgi:hypothetical protein
MIAMLELPPPLLPQTITVGNPISQDHTPVLAPNG